MALYLNEEGRDSFNENATAAKLELKFLKEHGAKKVEILVNSGCVQCQKNNGCIFDIDVALDKMPVPNAKCTYDLDGKGNSFCRCTYLPAVDI